MNEWALRVLIARGRARGAWRRGWGAVSPEAAANGGHSRIAVHVRGPHTLPASGAMACVCVGGRGTGRLVGRRRWGSPEGARRGGGGGGDEGPCHAGCGKGVILGWSKTKGKPERRQRVSARRSEKPHAVER